jgi:hypothetical protein
MRVQILWDQGERGRQGPDGNKAGWEKVRRGKRVGAEG